MCSIEFIMLLIKCLWMIKTTKTTVFNNICLSQIDCHQNEGGREYIWSFLIVFSFVDTTVNFLFGTPDRLKFCKVYIFTTYSVNDFYGH